VRGYKKGDWKVKMLIFNENSIKPQIKPALFSKLGRFSSKVLEVIKSS